MLQKLTIENYALIEHLEFSPEKGLTVITGETGAGKSIIMGALGLILGQRADARSVRTDATKCIIEATFDISKYDLEPFFSGNELEYDATATIVRREIYATGKSRAFVNDTPVQLSVLKELGEALIDIHSQHQNLLLSQGTFQQLVVDTIAGNQKQRDLYTACYNEMVRLRRRLEELRETAASEAKEADYMRFQFNQLDEAHLRADEMEELEHEHDMLCHAEEIKTSLLTMDSLLDGENKSILQDLKHVLDEAHGLSRIYPSIAEIEERIESAYIDLKDMESEIFSMSDDITFDQERLNFTEERIGILMSLLKKHSCQTIGELIEIRDSLDERLQHFDNSDEEIHEAELALEKTLTELKEHASALTESRKKAAKAFEKDLVTRLAYLGMPNVRFEVGITRLKDYSSSGIDDVTFLFSANKNQPLKPAGEVASGGEISRLMLSIKSQIASVKVLPTIIFDEIDTGVSGDIADRMGEVMKQMSQHMQVITITHLPQVAGKGDAHFVVFKDSDSDTTKTHINRLDAGQRIQEIARMLSGSKITDQAIENAKTLLR